MLVTRGNVSVGRGELRFSVALAQRAWGLAVDAKALTYDSRTVPRDFSFSMDGERAITRIVLLLRGTWIRFGERAVLSDTPRMFFSGPEADNVALRSGSDRFAAIQIAIPSSAVHPSPPALLATDAIWALAAQCVYGAYDAEVQEGFARLLERFEEVGILLPAPRERSTFPSRRLARVWCALAPNVATLSFSPALKELGSRCGASPRQIARDLDQLLAAIAATSLGWREACRRLRLEAAVLLLSAPGASVGEVARIVGYGSVDALGRAFRDAKLPCPRAVRAARRSDTSCHPLVIDGGERRVG